MSSDRDFLIEMLGLAAGLPDGERHPSQIMADPEISRYIIGWMRESDVGVVAIDESRVSIAAAWIRYLTAESPGYGYVSDQVPELAIAVVDRWRRLGVGRTLLRDVLDAARTRGVTTISLSAGRGSFQAELYANMGFRIVRSVENDDTVVMVAGVAG